MHKNPYSIVDCSRREIGETAGEKTPKKSDSIISHFERKNKADGRANGAKIKVKLKVSMGDSEEDFGRKTELQKNKLNFLNLGLDKCAKMW